MSADWTAPSPVLTSSRAPAANSAPNSRPPSYSTWCSPPPGSRPSTRTPPGKRFIFGGHAARVAGATFLALRGVPVAIIQLIGRWSSTAVERYTQQAPLAVAPGIPAQALAAGGHQTSAALGPAPAQLGNAQAAAALCDATPGEQNAPVEPMAAPGVPGG